MAVSLFSFKKTSASKGTSLIDPTKFGGAVLGAKKSSLRSEAAEKATALKEVKELNYIRRSLETLVSLEKRHFDMVGESIRQFALSEDKRLAKEEEVSQESKKDKDKKEEKNPIVKQGKKTLEGIGNFFQGLIKTFIAYKVLQWAGNPENAKKIQDFVNLFGNIFKFLNAIVGFGIDKLFSGLSKLVDGEGVTRVFGFLEAVVGFFTLKWLLNPTKIISDIKMIGNLFTKVIPNAINGVINFFSNLIPKAAGEAADEALSQAGKQITEGASSAAKGAATGAEAAGTAAKAGTTTAKAAGTAAKGAGAAAKGAGAAAAKGGAKVTGKSLLKALPVIGAVSSAFFAADRASKGDWLGAGGEVLSGVASLLPGWGTAASLGIDAALIGRDIAKEQGVPMLAKGGIVTKPTEAIVGEAGPEAILPLDKLGSFGVDEFKGKIDKQIPQFLKLLTLPFKIVGAGIVALISYSVSKIPGIGPILMPLISNVASMFGIPPSLVKGMSSFASAAIKSIGDKMSGVKELFGMQEPKITKSKTDEFKPSGDTSVRGLLGDILSALISKNSSSSTTETPPSTTTPSEPPSTTPSAEPSANPTKVGGSTKPMQENASLAKAGDSKVQNVAGTQRDLEKKGFNYIVNTANRFWQDSQGRLYEATTTRNNTSLATMMGVGDPVYKLKAVTEDQINKGFTAAGSERTVGSRNNQEIQRQLELFRIINKGGTLEKETTGSKTQVKQDDKWKDKLDGGKVPGVGGGDTVRALLEPQEYVLNKNAVRGIGGPTVLDKINFGMFPRFSSGGSVSITSNGPGSNKQLRPGSTIGFKDLNPHHSDEGRTRAYGGMSIGVPKDYGMGVLPNYMPSGPNGKVPLPVSGKVLLKEWNRSSGYGRTVIVETGLGKMQFSHLSKFGAFKEGDQLSAGSIIGIQGGSGNSGEKDYAEHLHLNTTKRGHEAFVNFITSGKPTTGSIDDTDSPGNENQGNNQNQQEAPATWSNVATELGQLAKLLMGAPTTPTASEPPPQQQPAKITGSIPARSQQLQATQKENAALQAQRRDKAQAGGNVINVPTTPQTTTETTTQPLAQPLGGTTPPIPLSLYPVAP